jgi:hypothetical protein
MAKSSRHIGIDNSGVETQYTSLKGLRVYMTLSGAAPVEVMLAVTQEILD